MNIITHDGTMHPDEIMACALLLLVYPDATIVRTRKLDEITCQTKEAGMSVITKVLSL